MRFEWDPAKNRANRKKHGVSFEEAVFVFTDRNALSIFDSEHSDAEDRWVTIGLVGVGKALVVVHLEKAADLMRIISARKATRAEVKQYAEAQR